MSFRTFTLDQLMQLNPSQLTTALRLFNQELDGTIAFLSQEPAARRDSSTLNELSNLLTLRDAFTVRLEELVAEQLAEKEGALQEDSSTQLAAA